MCALQTGVNDRTENYSVLSISRIEEFYHRAIGCADELRNRRSPRKYAAIKNVIYMSAKSLSIIAVEGNFPDCDFTNKQLFALGVFIRKINSIFILKGRSSEKKALERFFKTTFRCKNFVIPTNGESFKVEHYDCDKTAALDNFYSNIFDGYTLITDKETGVSNVEELVDFIVKMISFDKYFTIENSAQNRKFDTDLDFLNKGEFSLEDFRKSALSGYEENICAILKCFLTSKDVDFKGLNDVEFELYTNILSSGDFENRNVDKSGVAEFTYFKEIYDFL